MNRIEFGKLVASLRRELKDDNELGWSQRRLGEETGLGEVVLLLCLISFGSSMLNAVVYLVVVEVVPPHRTGEAIGTLSVVRGITSAIGSQMVAILLATDTLAAPGGAQLPSATGFRLTMGWIGGLTLLGACLALLLRRIPRPPQPVGATSPVG